MNRRSSKYDREKRERKREKERVDGNITEDRWKGSVSGINQEENNEEGVDKS